MKVIELYIMRRTLAIFAAALAWVLLIAWTTQVLNRLDLVTSSGQSAGTFFAVAALALPSVIPIIMPFAMGIAVAHTLALMNGDSELAVLSAAGSPRATIIRPILIIAILAGITSFAIDNTLEPYARQKLRQIISNANADVITSVVREGSFQQIDDGIFLHVAERLPGGELGGIMFADTRDETAKRIYYARRGATVRQDSGSVLVLYDGEMHQQEANGEVFVLEFESFPMDLSQFTRESGGPTLYAKDRYITYLFNPDPDDEGYAENPQRYRAEIHKRLTQWLYPIVFALIGIAVAGDPRSSREARLHPTVSTMIIGMSIWWIGYYAGQEAEANAAFTLGVYTVPLVMIALCSWFIATNRKMELPASWVEAVGGRLDRANNAVSGIGTRITRMFGLSRGQA